MRASQVCYPAGWEGRYAEEKADIPVVLQDWGEVL